MKRFTYIAVFLAGSVAALSSCNGNKRNPGKTYMPDMAYSPAYKSYMGKDSNIFTMNVDKKGGKIYYNGMPPAGTIKRGTMFPYTLPNDSNGYKQSAFVRNPLDTIQMAKAEMDEAGRLFDINCAVCHGAKGGGNGPIADKIGAVANLTLPNYVAMSDGTMFHSITYGIRNMGSYASQLTPKQRWEVIKYIRTLQGVGAAATKDSATAKSNTTTVAKDSTVKK